MLAPVLKKVVAENGKSILVKVDVDSSVETAGKYQVNKEYVKNKIMENRKLNLLFPPKIASLPTVFAFRNGKVIDKFIGFRDEATVRKFVNENSEE
jgi:thioredoxin 1